MKILKNININQKLTFYDEFNGEIIIRDENFTIKNLNKKEILEDEKRIFNKKI